MKTKLLKKLRRKHRIVPLKIQGFFTINSAPRHNGLLTYLSASKASVIERQRNYILADVKRRRNLKSKKA